MLKPLFTELRRLRWKLALAYTITTASVLTVLFILLAVVVYQENSSREQQARYIRTVLRQVAARAAPLLAAEPVDGERLSVLLTIALDRSGIGQISPQATMNLTSADAIEPVDLKLDDTISLLILDNQGVLVASTLLNPGPVIGQPFDTTTLPGLDSLLAGDLSQQQVFFDEAAGRAVIVAPIQGSRRLGTLIYRADGIPTWADETVRMLSSLGGLLITFTIAAAVVGLVFGLITATGLTRRLRRIEYVAAAWGIGDFAPRLHDRAADEIGQLSRQLNSVADQLENLIRERQQFATHDERNRLARDLHDSVKQHVFAASMSLGAAQELWQQDAAAAASLAGNAAQATSMAQRELTDIIRALRPPELEQKGLAQAISDVVAQWSQHMGIAASCQCDFMVVVPYAAEQALFRITQEALANIARHSGAKRVLVRLYLQQQQIILSIADDGHGFDPAQTIGGVGLHSMHERAIAIGATLKITSAATGTEARIVLPHGNSAAAVSPALVEHA